MLPDDLEKQIHQKAKQIPFNQRPQFYAEVRKQIERELLAADCAGREQPKAVAVERRQTT